MFWNTMPIRVERTARRWPRRACRCSRAPMKISPAVGSISRLRWRTSVDLPEPLRPMTQKISPGRTVRDVGHADDTAVAFADLVLARAAFGGGECGGFVGAEDLPEMPAVDGGVGHGLGLLPAWRPRPPYWAALASAIHSSHSVWCAAIQSVACFWIASSEFSP